MRLEFVVLPASLALAGAAAWVVARGGLTWRRALVVAGALAVFAFVFNFLVVERLQSWAFGQYFNHETITQGGLAAGALAIGLGLLPVIAGVSSLWLPERFPEPAYRAFAIYLGGIAHHPLPLHRGQGHLSAQPAPADDRGAESLLPLAAAPDRDGARVRRAQAQLAARGVGHGGSRSTIVWSGKFEVGAPYFDAPGLAVLTLVNRDFRWDVDDFHILLISAAAVSVALLVLRRRPWVPAVAAALLGGMAPDRRRSMPRTRTPTTRRRSRSRIPSPRNWVDSATHGAPVTFLGENVTDGTALWLTEFWNRSIGHVASLNGVAPGPGPITAPALDTTDGALSGYTGDPYTLAGPGVMLAAKPIESRDGFTLYRTPSPWHLLRREQNVFTDGWATSPIGYTYFPRGGPGVLTIHLSRTAYNGTGPPGKATIRVGTVRLDANGNPVLGRVLTVRRRLVPNGKLTVVRIPVAATPVTVEIGDDDVLATGRHDGSLLRSPGSRSSETRSPGPSVNGSPG